ncbi:hypothetical protein T11_10950 [Trichinella zimbabwensis]|uniref:Uncharacterized protein n=1 Tax=Trichinella zimbabwensis TaxID=268475 RepID=A0A0V1G8H4_9BILA|nr:hypothetical protein T11_10950 [Trichinella zimbabwensis]
MNVFIHAQAISNTNKEHLVSKQVAGDDDIHTDISLRKSFSIGTLVLQNS